jgi:DNA-binding NarL/FixJ family response regulator
MNQLNTILTEKGLTRQQIQVTNGVSRGLSNKEIATQLGILEKTVKFHLTNIYKKLSLKSRAQLIVFCLPYLTFSDPFETQQENG